MFGSDRKGAEAAIALTLFLCSLLFLTLSMPRIIGPYDEGITLVGAERVLHGAVPHRDFYALYGPGQFYVLAGLFKIFGASVLVERAWSIFVCAVSVALIYLMVQRAAPRAFAVVAAVFALLWFQINPSYGSAIIPCMAAMLVGFILVAPRFGIAGASPGLLGAGVCAGIVMLFRYDVGLAVFGTECALLLVSTWFERPGVRDRVGAIALGWLMFGAGFAIVTVPVAVAYTMNGVLPDLYYDVVAFPANAYARTRGLPLPRLWMLRKDPAEFIGVYLPVIMSVAAVPAVMAAARSKRTQLQWTLLALVALELVWFSKGFVRVSVVQMAMALVLCGALAAVTAQPIRTRGRIGTILAVVAVTLGVWTTAVKAPELFAILHHNITQPPTCRPAPGLERAKCFDLSPETVQTVQYVQQHTVETDPVFVGLYRHDKIFVNDVTLYFLLDRLPSTKWHHFDPGLQTTAAIQQEMIGELQRVRPPLVVLTGRVWEDSHEPNDSALSSGVTLLSDYISRAYEPAATFGGNTVLRLKSS